MGISFLKLRADKERQVYGGHMKRIRTHELKPGMIVAADVYNRQDQLVIPAETVLTEKVIARLSIYNIYFVKIKDEFVAHENKTEVSYAEKVRKSDVFKHYQKEIDDNVDLMKSVLSDFAREEVTMDAVDQVVDEAIHMLTKAYGDVNVFDLIHNMRQNSDLTYAHSINVALICHVLARWIGMTEEQATLAFTCGILHDIGKLRMPPELIDKTGKLTKEEFDKLKTHPIEGYNMLKNLPIDKHIKNAALMHHERSDGSGYPIGMKGDEIDKYARIVAIADVYEAATAPRVYRKGLSPFEVFAMFESEGIQKYDTQMIMTFMKKVADNYRLNRVRLSNGKEGEIVFINKQALARPTVRCGEEFIDLTKEKEITITEII